MYINFKSILLNTRIDLLQGSEPSLTSYNGVMKAAVDYIFYGGNGLDVTGVLKTVSDDSITRTGGIPDETYPSDHVSLKTSFSLS